MFPPSKRAQVGRPRLPSRKLLWWELAWWELAGWSARLIGNRVVQIGVYRTGGRKGKDGERFADLKLGTHSVGDLVGVSGRIPSKIEHRKQPHPMMGQQVTYLVKEQGPNLIFAGHSALVIFGTPYRLQR